MRTPPWPRWRWEFGPFITIKHLAGSLKGQVNQSARKKHFGFRRARMRILLPRAGVSDAFVDITARRDFSFIVRRADESRPAFRDVLNLGYIPLVRNACG
jgi:hypothetical protein